jgi:hypothetical protein
MSDGLDKQIELMKLQLELAKLQQITQKKPTTKNYDWCANHKPTHSFREWCIEIGNAIGEYDVFAFESSFDYLLEYFTKKYRDLDEDERPIVFVEKTFWIVNEKHQWVKGHKEDITEQLFRRLYNRILKKMWLVFAETDPRWSQNEKLNIKFMMTSNAILLKDENEEGFANLTYRIVPVIDVKDF